MFIPQVSPYLDETEVAAVTSVFRDNWLTEGPKTKEFSERLNLLLQTPFGVFAPNGTLALVLGLLAIDIKAGDEVIVPDITFVASANAVILVGATPVFAEVNSSNFQIDITACEGLITKRTKAIMPVHLYGMAANMEAVIKFAITHNLKVIEDAAQAIGVTYASKPAGTFGDVGCFSFFADKTITTGEGGYVVTRHKEIYERLLLLRNQGRLQSGYFIHPSIGYNFRITDLQAAIGLTQLDKLSEIIRRKLEIMEFYKTNLAAVKEIRFLPLESRSTYVPFRTVLLCERASELINYLLAHEIQTRTFFYPLHKQPCFAFLSKQSGQSSTFDNAFFPNACYGYEHGLCLPVFPTLSREQVDYVCDTIKEFYVRLPPLLR